jgi:hypothetical protein
MNQPNKFNQPNVAFTVSKAHGDAGMSFFIRAFAALCLLGLAFALAGCQGVAPGRSPSEAFSVGVPLKTAYDRALAQTNYCLVTEDRMPVQTSLSPDMQSGSIKVLMKLTNAVIAQTDLRAIDSNNTQVTVTMWGLNIWDAGAVSAMRAAIEFGVVSCTNYFPSQPTRRTRS